MAAMAPALTDAPAEAHHIRFKLAPPSSTLSPGSVENNSNASNILIPSNGPVKENSRDFLTSGKEEQQQPPPLVASYLCSDVTSVPSTKESLKLQGVLIKQSVLQTQSIVPGSYFTSRRPHSDPLDVTMSTAGHPLPSQALQMPLNGMAKKQTKGVDREGSASLNGGSIPGQDTQGEATARTLPKGGAVDQQGFPCNEVTTPPEGQFPSQCLDVKLGSSSPHPVEGELRERVTLSQNRQGEIEGRLRRLRKRLQVVQAKQVERHVQQQLGGLLQVTCARLPGPPTILTRKAGAELWQAAGDGLSRFLRSSSLAPELERLALSGSANLRAAENAFDSDVTDSSSGGETDAEEEELGKVDIEQTHISLWRRAEGRYSMERASIISHWNWLQAHISDLEYRIRQQTDIYRHIRANKGAIELGNTALCVLLPEDGVEVKDQLEKVEPLSLQSTQSPDRMDLTSTEQSPATEPALWKGCTTGRQVNGVISSLHSGLSETVDGMQSLSPDNSCVAARSRPLSSCRRRRLVRPNTVANLNRKVQKNCGIRGSCETNPVCVMCGGSRSNPSGEFQYKFPVLERLAQFDPCVHPILSFTDDISMNLHLQRVLKAHWQNKPLEKTKPLKKLAVKHKISLNSRLVDHSKDRHRLSNPTSSLLDSRLSHHKIRPLKLHRQQLDSLLNSARLVDRPFYKAERSPSLSQPVYDRSNGRKRPREHSLDRTEFTPKQFLDVSSPCPVLPSMHTPTHSPLIRQLSTSSDSSMPLAPSNTPTIRRRRGESSFDINNIVIPMSVAATTRVEKLQYKEILTPSWRKVDVCTQPIAEEDENVELEDLTDTAFAQLHLPFEEQERSRWTWVASAPAKRRGSRSFKSLDGRSTPLLGGTTPSTPQPASPETLQFHTLQDYGPVPSPHSPASPEMLSYPHTPCSRDSHRMQSSEDTRCSTPDFSYEELTVQPWERRNFPLSEEPTTDAEEQSSPECDRGFRSIRRISGSRSTFYRLELDSGPASPATDDSSKQKTPAHR